jgi:hypothetical protein
MTRLCLATALAALLVTAQADARSSAKCKRHHGHVKKVCKHKKTAVTTPKAIPVTTTLLDGSTLTTSAGTFGIAGTIKGSIPGQISLNSETTVNDTDAAFSVAPGAPCGPVALAVSPPLSVAPSTYMLLNGDGVVFLRLQLVLPDCGGDVLLLLAGKVGAEGLNGLVLDSTPGAVTAHLALRVDLSGKS